MLKGKFKSIKRRGDRDNKTGFTIQNTQDITPKSYFIKSLNMQCKGWNICSMINITLNLGAGLFYTSIS